MKIIKRPAQIIFDTRNPNHMQYAPDWTGTILPLYAVTGKNDMDSLIELFPSQEFEEHPIFEDFGKSSYWIIEASQHYLKS